MNELYPIFLKVHQLETLLVGAGFVGLEKLSFLLKSSPQAKVTVVSIEISDEIREIAEKIRISSWYRRPTTPITWSASTW